MDTRSYRSYHSALEDVGGQAEGLHYVDVSQRRREYERLRGSLSAHTRAQHTPHSHSSTDPSTSASVAAAQAAPSELEALLEAFERDTVCADPDEPGTLRCVACDEPLWDATARAADAALGFGRGRFAGWGADAFSDMALLRRVRFHCARARHRANLASLYPGTERLRVGINPDARMVAALDSLAPLQALTGAAALGGGEPRVLCWINGTPALVSACRGGSAVYEVPPIGGGAGTTDDDDDGTHMLVAPPLPRTLMGPRLYGAPACLHPPAFGECTATPSGNRPYAAPWIDGPRAVLKESTALLHAYARQKLRRADLPRVAACETVVAVESSPFDALMDGTTATALASAGDPLPGAPDNDGPTMAAQSVGVQHLQALRVSLSCAAPSKLRAGNGQRGNRAARAKAVSRRRARDADGGGATQQDVLLTVPQSQLQLMPPATQMQW